MVKKHLLIPDYIFDSILEITPAFLAQQGVRGVLVDIDGTAASHHAPLPTDALRAWVENLQKAEVSVLFLSNNRAERVQRFAEAVGVPWLSRACKPLLGGFRRGLERLGLLAQAVAVIGDQVYTDTLGGNRLGLKTCLVRSIDRHEPFIRLRWLFERPFAARAKKHKGE